jgi:hypothetical protein
MTGGILKCGNFKPGASLKASATPRKSTGDGQMGGNFHIFRRNPDKESILNSDFQRRKARGGVPALISGK